MSLAAFEKEGEVLGHIGPAMAMEAYWFFANNTRRVEVSREGLLERVYFPRPLLAFYLTDVTKSLFMWQVNACSIFWRTAFCVLDLGNVLAADSVSYLTT